MKHRHDFPIRLDCLTLFIGLVALYGLSGCNDPGDALPPATNVTVKRDAGGKRDTSLGSAIGGAEGSTVAVGTGGSGGTTDIVGSGGSTTTTALSDAAIPSRDVSPDQVGDTIRTAQDVGADASTPVDVATEVQRDIAPQDQSQPDAPGEGLRDALDAAVDTRDGPTDLPADLGPDIFSDMPGDDTPEVGPDLPADLSPDLASIDLPQEVAAGPTCSNPGWAKQLSLRTPSWLSGDKEGNLFLASSLLNSVAFGGTAGTLTSLDGFYDALVVRFDPTTGSAVWAAQFGDGQEQTASGVAVDKSGRVGFIGNYSGSMTIATSSISNLGTWQNGYVGGLQSSDGAGLWVISANLSADVGSSGILAAIAANPAFDNFVVCGKANVAATELVEGAVSGGGYDIVVAKISGSDGTILWSRQIGGTGDQACTAVAIDDYGDAIIAGTFNGQLDFGSGALNPAPVVGSTVPWVAKLSGSNGSTIAATNASPGAIGRTQGPVYGIDTDSAGNIAIAGSFTNALTFGSTTLTSAGSNDAYVVKFGSTLSPSWAKRWGDTKLQSANAVAFDSNGDLTVVGHFLGTINIGATGAILTASSDITGSNSDVFFARLSGTSGDSQCALSYGDPLAQAAYNLVVPRSATGATKDVAFASGNFVGNSVLNFGSVSLDTTGLADPNYSWLARF